MEPNGILIFGELTNKCGLRPVVKELITKSRELKTKLWNQKISVCVIGPRIKYDDIIKELEEYGADEAVIVNDDRLKDYNTIYYSDIFTQLALKYPPRIILAGATYIGKEIAAYTAAKLETGLTADCTDLSINDINLLVSTRPTFGGKLTADILCKTFPQMATVQEHIFTAEKTQNKSNINVIFNWIDLDKTENKIQITERKEKNSGHRSLSDAKIIVSGGAGACKDDGFSLIYQLAQRLGAAVGGSREAYERGYITKSQQIGQTGTAVAPELYIAVGISGANQHIGSITNSKKIIAINNDPEAPIFNYADIGIKGDLFKVLPELIKKFD